MEIIISNLTSASEITITEPNIAMFGSIFAPIISVITISLIGYFTIRFYQKQHKKNVLIDIFEIFASNHKASEEEIFDAYRKNELYDVNEIKDYLRQSAKFIVRNYDQIGLLFDRNLIPKKEYFLMYGRLTVVIHHVLFLAIDRERKRGRKHHLIFFTKLAIQCYDYWKEKNIPRDPKSNQDISQDTINVWKSSLDY